VRSENQSAWSAPLLAYLVGLDWTGIFAVAVPPSPRCVPRRSMRTRATIRGDLYDGRKSQSRHVCCALQGRLCAASLPDDHRRLEHHRGRQNPRTMNPDALVVWGAGLGTFVASIMADDQSERLRNGAFGTIAGASLGGIAALFEHDRLLVLYGVFGSAIGAGGAWLVYLILAFVARKPAGRRILEYHIRGLAGVHEQLIADENTRLREALDSWGANFARTISHEKDVLVREGKTGSVNTSIELAIYNWLSTIVNTFNLVLDAIAETPLDYRCRATLILFGHDDKGNRSGGHWISFAGRLPRHRTARFDASSYAFKVLTEEFQSPSFTTAEAANKEGQERGGAGRYYSFILFRVNDRAILSVDWPGKLEENDPYILIVRNLFHLEVGPAVAELLNMWSGDLEEEIGLQANQHAAKASPSSDLGTKWADCRLSCPAEGVPGTPYARRVSASP
jgi:hypothetical protein